MSFVTLGIPISAQNGGTGITSPGTAGNVLTSTGSGWTSAASSSGSFTAVASGSLSNGATVVVNSNGTVSAVNDTSGPGVVTGSEAVVSSMTSSNGVNAFWDANTSRVVVAYADNSLAGQPTVIAGSVNFSTGVITWGSSQQLNFAGSLGAVRIAYDSNTSQFVFGWTNTSGVGYVMNATLSGTTFTFGTLTTLDAGKYVDQINLVYATATNNIVAVYSDELGGSSTYTWSRTLTNSGSSINLGTAVNFSGSSAYSTFIRAVYDTSAQRVFVAYRQASTATARGVVGSISGTSITFGTDGQIGSFTNGTILLYYDIASSKPVVFIQASATTAVVVTISGLTASYGTGVAIIAGTQLNGVYAAPTPNGTLISFYRNPGSGNVIATVWGIVSGTTTSWGDASNTSIPSDTNITIVYAGASNKRFITTYQRTSTTYRSSILLQSPLSATNFVGFSSATYSSGATATINAAGSVNSAQAGLTAGNQYYVQLNGSLSTTAGSPSVFAGTAVSSTAILVKG